jgi:catechol 2,3-dioxygenase-like lactoylglutathione lyase family enzyme
MITRVAVVNLWAPDVETAVHFYGDVLGLRPLPGHDNPPHFIIQGVMLAIVRGDPQPALNPNPERFPLIAFAVDDLDAMVSRLEEAAVKLPWGVEGTAETPWIMLYDPAGNLIEIAQLPSLH